MNSMNVCLLFLCFICCFFNGKYMMVMAANTTDVNNTASTLSVSAASTENDTSIGNSETTMTATDTSTFIGSLSSITSGTEQTTSQTISTKEQATTTPSTIACYWYNYTCQNDSCWDDRIEYNRTCDTPKACFVSIYNTSSEVYITAGCSDNCTYSHQSENKTSCCTESQCNTADLLRLTTTIKPSTTHDYSGSHLTKANVWSVIAAFILFKQYHV